MGVTAGHALGLSPAKQGRGGDIGPKGVETMHIVWKDDIEDHLVILINPG